MYQILMETHIPDGVIAWRVYNAHANKYSIFICLRCSIVNEILLGTGVSRGCCNDKLCYTKGTTLCVTSIIQ